MRKAQTQVTRFLASALCTLVVGCGAGATTPVASGHAVASNSRFQLDFSLPRTDWSTTDSITGEATLSFLGSGSVSISGSEFIWYEFDEVGGTRHVTPIDDLICTYRDLSAQKPITSGITKSGGWLPDDPNAGFFQSFFANPQVRLPVGDWTITAISSFSEGSCGDSVQTLRASVVVHVTSG